MQIWRGKDSVAYLVELAEGRPVAREQKQLSAEQTERLGAALAELASIETMIRDCEKDWKSQLIRLVENERQRSAIDFRCNRSPTAKNNRARTAYYKKLFDEQHAGLDKLLSQFEPPADPAIPKP